MTVGVTCVTTITPHFLGVGPRKPNAKPLETPAASQFVSLPSQLSNDELSPWPDVVVHTLGNILQLWHTYVLACHRYRLV